MTILSPLQLRWHVFTEIRLRSVLDGKATNPATLDTQISFNPEPGQPDHWRLSLVVKVVSKPPDEPFAYDAQVAIQGLVSVDSSVEESRREQLAVVNGLSMLYGAVRELILTLTARSANGALGLPTVNFVEVVAQARAKQAAAAPAQ